MANAWYSTGACKPQSVLTFNLKMMGSHWSSKNQCDGVYILNGAALAAVSRAAWNAEGAEWKGTS